MRAIQRPEIVYELTSDRLQARRMECYANRFNIHLERPSLTSCSSNIASEERTSNLLLYYRRILHDANPNLALARAIHEIEVRASEAERFLIKVQSWEVIRDRIVNSDCTHRMSSIQTGSVIVCNHHSPDVIVYLTQLRSGRDKLIQLANLRESLIVRISARISEFIHQLIESHKQREHPLCLESNLREYATAVRETSVNYKNCVADIDGLAENVHALEREVHELDRLKSQLDQHSRNVDIHALSKRYEFLGVEKVHKMESVTDAVQDLIRQLAHKRNILAPKLNDLNALRRHVEKQEQEIREHARTRESPRQFGSVGEGDLKLLESKRDKLLGDMREIRYEIEYLGACIKGGFTPQFPNVSADDAPRMINTFNRLSHLLRMNSS